MSSAFHGGCACRVSAATPAPCGEAIAFPERLAAAKPVPLPAEKMLTPGAVTSGLSALSPLRGPPELNEPNALKAVLATVAPVTLVICCPFARRILAPSDGAVGGGPARPMNGMVTVYGSPVSALEVIGPSNGGSPVALLTMITAAAPACC